jgi:hypothetical protein
MQGDQMMEPPPDKFGSSEDGKEGFSAGYDSGHIPMTPLFRRYAVHVAVGGSLPSRVERGVVSGASKQTTYAMVYCSRRKSATKTVISTRR